MDLFSEDLMYEFHSPDLTQVGAIKQYADHTVREIKATVGWDADVQVNIEPEAKAKHVFSVSMGVFGLGTSIVIKKQGKHVLAVLRKVRKALMRQLHAISKRRVTQRKKRYIKEQYAC